jgi:outer membrane protein
MLSRAAWLLLASFTVAWADDEDSRMLRDQAQRLSEQKSQLEQAPTSSTALHYEGQDYHVPDQLDTLEPAIYIAINSKQWGALPGFISRYRQIAGHRPALAAMGEGLLAHAQGDYPLALRHMQAASGAEPQDVRIRLELARLWFEDNQDQAATTGFSELLKADLPPFAQQMVQQYREALAARADWHGSAALGWGYNNNINQGNGDYACLQTWEGLCLNARQMPEALGSNGFNYELALQRRINLAGNHNLQIRPMLYGNDYAQSNPSSTASIQDYSSHLAALQLGYQYLDARDSLTLLPYTEYLYRNRHRDYQAYGVQLEWRHALSGQWQLGSSLDVKRFEYSQWGSQSAADYQQYQWGGFASYSPTASTNLYGGIDFTRKQYEAAVASSRDWSFRAGVYH